MSNQAGIRKPRLSVMGITGAVGQMTLTTQEFWMDSDRLINLEMVWSDCVENGRPTMAGVAKAVQKYHGSSLNRQGYSNELQKGYSDDMIYQRSYAYNFNQTNLFSSYPKVTWLGSRFARYFRMK